MRIVMNVVMGLLLAVAFAACQKANDPVSPVLANKTDIISSQLAAQSYDGSFEVTYKNYRNTDASSTMKGSIDIIFNKSNYTYNGELSDNPGEDVTLTSIHDSGTFSTHGDIISMFDNATKMMNAGWMPSLYLSGDYSYSHIGDQIIIEGDGNYGSIKIVLKTTPVGG